MPMERRKEEHTFVTGVVEASLPVCLQMTGDVGGAEHLATDVAGDLALMPDHMGAQTIFGGESRGAGLEQCIFRRNFFFQIQLKFIFVVVLNFH